MLKSNDCYLDIEMTNTCNVHNINIIIDLRIKVKINIFNGYFFSEHITNSYAGTV